jgi:hypothetical protein
MNHEALLQFLNVQAFDKVISVFISEPLSFQLQGQVWRQNVTLMLALE